MPVKSRRYDFHVRVEPHNPGDYGFCSISGAERTEDESVAICEEIAIQIRRHIDNLPTRGNKGVSISWKTEEICEYCGYNWGEDSDEFNGGCCDKDIEHEPKDTTP